MFDFTKDISFGNELVTLLPLEEHHYERLFQIAQSIQNWEHFQHNLSASDKFDAWFQSALQARRNWSRYPFVVIDNVNDKIAGTTSIGNIKARDKRLEIGWTWIGSEFQGYYVNKNAKYILLQFAFESLQFERVEFTTDDKNAQCKKALQKIGAVEEGVLRSHRKMPDNTRSDTVLYSILRQEWPHIKSKVFQNIENSVAPM